ncbi:MAG: hypothetical protein E7075_10145 [Bacteroidales bacterium]|nr:hypothetical protein [Bacteroidales bacterium]
MKKVTLFFALLLGMFLLPSVETHAAEPRVMAYDLHLDPTAPAGFVRFCYTLNTDAEKVYIIMYAPNGEVAWRRDITSETRRKKGAQSWTFAQLDLPSFKGMTWAIEAQGTAITNLVCINDLTKVSNYGFNRPKGIAVDNNPESEAFGHMYITLPKAGGSSSTYGAYGDTKAGVVVFDAIHNRLASGVKATDIAVEDETFGLHRVAVNPKSNEVYYTKSIKDKTGIYELTPNSTDILSDGGEAKNVIDGLGFTSADALCIENDGTIWVMDYANLTTGGTLYKIKDGEKIKVLQSSIWGVQEIGLASDGRGGVWIAQNRGGLEEILSALSHVNAKGELDLVINKNATAELKSLLPNTNGNAGFAGACAYNATENILAFGGNYMVTLFKVDWDNNNKPTLTRWKDTGKLTQNINGVAFDYAGNIVFVSRSAERFYHYAVPTDNNTCITPAKKSSTFDGAPVARVFAYGLNVVDNGNSYTFSFTPNASATTGRIVVYNGETKAQVAEFAISAPLTKGVKKEVTINKEDLPKLLGMTWAIELSSNKVESIAVLHNYDDVAKYGFNRPQDVAIDNNPESDFFGRMYIALPKAGGTSYSDAQAGIVVFDPLHKRLASGLKATGVSLTSDDRLGMHRIAVNPLNNKVYYAKSESSTAVYELTPDATNILSDGGTAKNAISGISAITNANSLCFDAEGAMYVMDNAASGTGIIYKVSNGVAEEWKKTTGSLWGNADNALASDGRGGIWVAVQRYTLDNCYSLSHVNKNKEIDFKLSAASSATLKALFPDNSNAFSRRGHVAYNSKDDILAFGTNRCVALFKVTYGTSDISLELIGRTPTITKTNANIDGLAFDYAGNLVVLSATSERFYHYTVPTDNNVCLVPAKSTLTIDGEVGEVTYILNGGVWNEYGWSSKDDMYSAILIDIDAITPPTQAGTNVNAITLAEDKIKGVKLGIPTYWSDLTVLLTHASFKEKWGWLIAYMDDVCSAQNKTKPSIDQASLRYNLSAFFLEDQYTSWPYSADFTEAGKDAAYIPVWGQSYGNPEFPINEVKLYDPCRKGYKFDGWYTTADFAGSQVTKVDNTFKGTLYAKWTQSGIVYELNGGVWNNYGWTNKSEMFAACMAEAGVTGLASLDELKAAGATSFTTICTPLNATKCQVILDSDKWEWLEQYIMSVQNPQKGTIVGGGAIAELTANTADAGWRYAIAAFFLEMQNTAWPRTADFSEAGKDAAYIPAWGQSYGNPEQPTTEVELYEPIKANHTFEGWYANEDFSGNKVTKVNADYAGTLYAKWNLAPVLYELNGGQYNEYGWESKKDVYDDFIADWNTYSGTTRKTAQYEDQLGIGKSNGGIPTTITTVNSVNHRENLAAMFTNPAYSAKWGWLATYLDAVAAQQGKTQPTSNANTLTFSLGNFFGEDNNHSTDYIGAVDFTGDERYLVSAQPYCSFTLPNPTYPTSEVTINNPTKEGYIFDGWYANADFSGAKVTKVNADTKGTLYAKWNAVYTRDVTNGKYGTICLPYNSNYFEGAIFYEVAWMNTSVSPWQVLVDEVTELEAGKPYIFMAKSNNILVACQGDAIENPSNHNGLYGTFTDINDGPAGTASNVLEDNHMLSNNQIMKCLGNCQLLANRAYFKLGEIPTVEPALVPGRRRVALGVQGGNEATGVDNLTEDGLAPAMEGTYDVLGRKMTEPTNNSFYIVNGKKVVVLK